MDKTENFKRDSFADLVGHVTVTIVSLILGFLIALLVVMVIMGIANGTEKVNLEGFAYSKWVAVVGTILSTLIATYLPRALL